MSPLSRKSILNEICRIEVMFNFESRLAYLGKVDEKFCNLMKLYLNVESEHLLHPGVFRRCQKELSCSWKVRPPGRYRCGNALYQPIYLLIDASNASVGEVLYPSQHQTGRKGKYPRRPVRPTRADWRFLFPQFDHDRKIGTHDGR